ncbi:uncharacterized protein LOC115621523 [Scaptodrosophila lebanonensis]|uniref:Uncharacterized protein LOC115621523 n=1 Tax=Drosophila lebanonensis TaxID=7225 RepID=A0A6J2T4V0_DROLE|nr:uncharacterized protein LOC115621523 [Scaptodrosophila lebanonensis]
MWSRSSLWLIVFTLAAAVSVEAKVTIEDIIRNSDNDSWDSEFDNAFAPILGRFGSDVLELHVHSLRDCGHMFVQFLLRQPYCTIVLSLFGKGVASQARHHFWLFTNLAQMRQSLPQFVNYGGVYILALELFDTTDDDLLQFMLKVWQQHGHNRIYYVLPEARILLYNPFKHIIMLADEPDAYARIFRNLYGQSLRCYIFDSVYSAVYGDAEAKRVLSVSGADAKLASVVAARMNFTLNYLWPDDEFFGGRLDNGSFSGAIGRVHRHELDIVFAGFFIKDYLTRGIEFSSAVYMDELCLFVQKAKRIPQSILPLFAVRLDVWLCFLLVGPVCAFVWICIRRLNLELNIESIVGVGQDQKNFRSTVVRIFIDTLVVWVRVNVGQFPPFYSERIFLASLCLVSVIFGALLESSLATVYIRPLYYRDINTLMELDESQQPIYIKHPAFRDDLFVGHDSAVYKSLHAKMLLVGEGEDRLISMVANRGGFSGVTRAGSLMLSDIRYIMTNRIHKIPECPKNYHIAYVLQRHSPYLDMVNTVVLRACAAGLIELWTGEMKERAKWSIHKFPEYLAALGVGNWKVLKLTDVQLAFYALALGCVLAALVCSTELLWNHWRK